MPFRAPACLSLNDEEPVGKFIVNQPVHYGSRAVGRSVVDYEYMETLFQSEHSPDNLLYVLLLVVSGYYYNTVAFVHGFVLFVLMCYLKLPSGGAGQCLGPLAVAESRRVSIFRIQLVLCKDNAIERNVSLFTDCREQLILCKDRQFAAY